MNVRFPLVFLSVGDEICKCGKQKICACIPLDTRGGLPIADGHVGACQRLECAHNKDLLCTAPEVSIAGDSAHCTMFELR